MMNESGDPANTDEATPPVDSRSEQKNEWRDVDSDARRTSTAGAAYVRAEVQAKNSFVNCTFLAPVKFDKDSDPGAVVIDVSDSIEKLRASFVYDALARRNLSTILEQRSILIIGGAARTGKHTLAGMILYDLKKRPIFQLPGDMTFAVLIKTVQLIADENSNAGIIVESASWQALAHERQLNADALVQNLRVAGDIRVIITTDSVQNPFDDEVEQAIPFRAVGPPDPTDVALATCGAGITAATLGLIQSAVGLLPPPVGPGTARALGFAANDQPTATAEELANRFSGAATAALLKEWLQHGQTADNTAYLTSVATCEGASVHAAEECAKALTTKLLDARLGTDEERRAIIERGDRMPHGLVVRNSTTENSHFGRHNETIVCLDQAHHRRQVIEYLWDRLGYDYQVCFLEWLSELPSYTDVTVRIGASYTAGVLFLREPRRIEERVIGPWARSESREKRFAAALALGVPAALDEDTAAARSLAHNWANSSSISLNEVAILSYGGLLGAWDPASSAAAHLWVLSVTTSLQPSAFAALGRLLAAGATARRARAGVIGLLQNQTARRPSAARAYASLPYLFRSIVAPDKLAQDSLNALMSEAETMTRERLARLLLSALTTTAGRPHGSDCLWLMLRAVSRGHLSEQHFISLIRELRRAAATREEYDSLGRQLRRSLENLKRREGRAGVAADRLINQFFSQGEQHGAILTK